MKNVVLVVAAHPDDEVLGCGGTIAKHTASGDDVHILIMAEGLTSRDSTRNASAHKQELTELHANSQKVAEILGAKSVTLHNFSDNRMDSVDLLDVVKAVEKIKDKVKPNIIYTHHAGDVNIDHQITHNAVVTACRPQPGECVKRILFFETVSSTEWQMSTADKMFYPNWFVNIGDVFETKMTALKCYKTEMRKYPHSRSYEAVEFLARTRGFSIGVKYAEAFTLGRNICTDICSFGGGK